jgi:hypothetical protein
LILCAGLPVAFLSLRRRLHWSVEQLHLLGMAALCGLLYVISPETFSGGWGFDQRFPIFGLIFLLAALASSPLFQQYRPGWVLVAASVLIGAGTLLYQVNFCGRYQIAGDLYRMPPVTEGSAGAIVMDSTALYQPAGLSFSPYRWVGAFYMLKSKSGFLNAPFLHTSVMPMLARPNVHPADPYGMERILLWGKPGVVPDFLVYIGEPGHRPQNEFFEFIKRYGYTQKCASDVASIFTRPAHLVRALRTAPETGFRGDRYDNQHKLGNSVQRRQPAH